jgi:coenzyme F420-reducing hydrogenase alpha subunit
MRKTLLTMALAGLLVLPVLAQRPGFGGRGVPGGDSLLLNKSVQTELKLDDKQLKTAGEIAKKRQEGFAKVMEAFQDGDREKGMELGKKNREATAKALKDFQKTLTSTQAKRFQEIEVQLATKYNQPNIFKNESVQKALKLSDKQKDTVKETLSDFEKDQKELFDDAKGDRKKFREIGKKMESLRKDAYAKITKSFTSDQTKAWKDAGGEAFELKIERPNFLKDKGPRKDKGKKDSKKPKDDF